MSSCMYSTQPWTSRLSTTLLRRPSSPLHNPHTIKPAFFSLVVLTDHHTRSALLRDLLPHPLLSNYPPVLLPSWFVVGLPTPCHHLYELQHLSVLCSEEEDSCVPSGKLLVSTASIGSPCTSVPESPTSTSSGAYISPSPRSSQIATCLMRYSRNEHASGEQSSPPKPQEWPEKSLQRRRWAGKWLLGPR